MPHTGHQNLEHVREFPADCGDPDCELHSPWVIEDESERLTAIAWYVAGARSVGSPSHDLAIEALENILDELSAPDVP